MNQFFRAAFAGLLLSLACATSAMAADVAVRVEGQNATLLASKQVAQPGAPIAGVCGKATAAAQAIDLATNRNWDRQEFIQTVLGETHKFEANDFWGLWVKRGGVYKVANGACTEELAAGEELLVAYQEADPVTFEFKLAPLSVSAPATATAGQPFSVTVSRSACETSSCNPGEGRLEPAAGATVTAGSATATAGADGRATLTVGSAGTVSVNASSATGIRASAPVTVNAPPAAPAPSGPYDIPPVVQPPVVDTTPPAADTTRPTARIRGLKARYRKGKGPRRLRAGLSDDVGIGDVKLALTRTRGRKCTGYGDQRGRFRRVTCGRRILFSVGSETSVDYLLPKKLRRGKYRFDVIAIDQAGNRTEVRKRFRVR